jgi:uncharacterized repeat protein (TIGR01451 family)
MGTWCASSFPNQVFTDISVADVNTATLAGYDTVFMYASTPNALSATQKTDLVNWVAAGGKLIICPGEDVYGGYWDYSWLPYPITLSIPGAMGAQGTLIIVENSVLTQDAVGNPINVAYLSTGTDAVGDADVMTTLSTGWCAAMTATNYLGVTGPVEMYCKWGQGLILFNGLDWDVLGCDWWGDAVLTQVMKNMFEVSSLTCGAPWNGNLDVTKTADKGSYCLGDTITFTVTVTNNQPVAATSVQWTDTPPAEITMATTSGTVGTGTLAANGGTATFTVTATADAVGTGLVNEVLITGVGPSSVPFSGSADATFDIENCIKPLDVTKTADKASYCIDDTITFTVTVTNNQPVAATNVQWSDKPPAEITMATTSGTVGTGTLAANGGTATFTVTATADAAGTGLVNEINITGDGFFGTATATFDIVDCSIPVSIDIKPGSCPNLVTTRDKGLLIVTIPSTNKLDVKTIDPSTIKLGLAATIKTKYVPITKSSLEDLSTPYTGGEACGCHNLLADGKIDLSLRFDMLKLIQLLKDAGVTGTFPLTITGNLKKEFGGTPIKGTDCIKFISTGTADSTSESASSQQSTASVESSQAYRGNYTIALQASNGQYISAKNGGGDGVFANGSAVGTWEKFNVIDLGDRKKIALQASNGQYVSAEETKGGLLVANRNAIGPWETFNVSILGDRNIALQASNGQYVSAEETTGLVIANRDTIGPWETMKLIPI